jgi:hypothetical protein
MITDFIGIGTTTASPPLIASKTLMTLSGYPSGSMALSDHRILMFPVKVIQSDDTSGYNLLFNMKWNDAHTADVQFSWYIRKHSGDATKFDLRLRSIGSWGSDNSEYLTGLECGKWYWFVAREFYQGGTPPIAYGAEIWDSLTYRIDTGASRVYTTYGMPYYDVTVETLLYIISVSNTIISRVIFGDVAAYQVDASATGEYYVANLPSYDDNLPSYVDEVPYANPHNKATVGGITYAIRSRTNFSNYLIVAEDASELPYTVEHPTTDGDKGSVNDGTSTSYSTLIETWFSTAISNIASDLTSPFTKTVRSTDTGNFVQDIINAAQNVVDEGFESLHDFVLWLIQQLINSVVPMIQSLFGGVYNNISSYIDNILGWITNTIDIGVEQIIHLGDILKGILAGMASTMLDIVDAEVSYTDLTPYWNNVISVLAYDFDSDYPNITIPGIGIGLSALPDDTLLIPDSIVFNGTVEINLEDIIFWIFWMKKLPTWHIDILGEGIPLPLGMLYWVLKDLKVPLSTIFNDVGLQPTAGKYSGFTDGFSFKDITYTWFLFDVISVILEKLGMDKKYLIMIFNQITQRFKPNLKDVISRMTQPGDPTKYEGSPEVTLSDRVDNISTGLTSLSSDVTTLASKIDDITLSTEKIIAVLTNLKGWI